MTGRSAAYAATWQQLFDVTGAVGRGALTPEAWRGAGGARLAHSDGAWTGAAAGLREVGGALGRVGPGLTEAHAGVAAGAAGLSAVGTLAAVRESWERRFAAAVVECEALARALVSVAEGQDAREASVRGSFGGGGGSGGAGAAVAPGPAGGAS